MAVFKLPAAFPAPSSTPVTSKPTPLVIKRPVSAKPPENQGANDPVFTGNRPKGWQYYLSKKNGPGKI